MRAMRILTTTLVLPAMLVWPSAAVCGGADRQWCTRPRLRVCATPARTDDRTRPVADRERIGLTGQTVRT